MRGRYGPLGVCASILSDKAKSEVGGNEYLEEQRRRLRDKKERSHLAQVRYKERARLNHQMKQERVGGPTLTFSVTREEFENISGQHRNPSEIMDLRRDVLDMEIQEIYSPSYRQWFRARGFKLTLPLCYEYFPETDSIIVKQYTQCLRKYFKTVQ